MDSRQVILGLALIVIFWAYNAGYLNSLGATAWFLGSIILVAIFYLIGQGVMPKAPADMKELWQFTSLFAIVATFVVSYLPGPLGASMISTSTLLSLWLVIFGSAMVITGWKSKWGVTMWTGLFWLFGSVSSFSYLSFGFAIGLPFVIYGLVMKD